MEIKLTPKRKEILAKRGLRTNEDFIRFFPRKYKDYTKVYESVTPEMNGAEGCFIGVLTKLTSKQTASKCTNVNFKLIMVTGQKVSVNNFGKSYLKESLKYLVDNKVIVCGMLNYHPVYGFTIMDPDKIVKESMLLSVQKVEPVYTKISGISEETMSKLIANAIISNEYDEWDAHTIEQRGIKPLPTLRDAYKTIHYPQSMEEIADAAMRIDLDDLFSFAKAMEEKSKKEVSSTHIKIKTYKKTKELIASLPYECTLDQKKAYREMISDNLSGKRISALLQGDVGCGKSITAFLLLITMAENGYQGVIMAPTAILAKQHYAELKGYCDMLGLTVGYLDGDVKASAKKDILCDLISGKLQILVGTQAISSTDPMFHNLGMVVIDEEHRFGVEQREVLMRHAQKGVNTILMSATPMPRSLAGSIHGNGTKIYDIKTMPSCRIPVQTAINNNKESIFNFIESQLKQGRQAYVVCPLIETNEESELMKDVISATDRLKEYRERFSPTYRVELLNGKMKDEEINHLISEYKEGKIHILISTTVIEVGVNVPNASVMVISNAERFGLAAMHQLRGRVGRGSYKSYCILQSTERDNERLRALVNCADGFSIAEMDLKLRGAGELVGTKQSGFTRQMNLVYQYPKEYDIFKEILQKSS